MAPARDILPRALALAAAAAACTACALCAGGAVGWLPGLMLAACLLLCWLYLALLPRGLRFEAGSPRTECERGEHAGVSLQAANTGWLPCLKGEALLYVTDLFGEESSLLACPFALAPRSQLQLQTQVRFDHVGSYRAGVRALRVYDPLGLFWRTVAVSCSCEVEVLPRIWHIGEVEVDTQAAAESNTALVPVVNEGMDYAGVRDYAFGDPMKLVHWKLSARAGSKYTRLFEAYTNPGMAVVLDFYSPEYPRAVQEELFDLLVESAFSLVVWAQEQGLDSELRFTDRDGQPVAVGHLGPANMAEVLRCMPRINGAGTREHHLEELESQANNRYGKGNLVLCCAHVSREVCELLAAAKGRQKNPLLYAAVPLARDQRERDEYLRPLRALEEASIPYRVLSSAAELEGLA